MLLSNAAPMRVLHFLSHACIELYIKVCSHTYFPKGSAIFFSISVLYTLFYVRPRVLCQCRLYMKNIFVVLSLADSLIHIYMKRALTTCTREKLHANHVKGIKVVTHLLT